MDGRDVFRHAVTRMPESATAALTKAGYTWDDVSLLIPHQANLRISEAVQKSLKLRDDQVYNNIMRYGNTTAATIPIATAAPRQSASAPIAPVPAHRSSQRQPAISNCQILKTASRTRDAVGRVSNPGTV